MSDERMKLLDENTLLTEKAMNEIAAKAAILDCECPRHMVTILRSIREFQRYEQGCMTTSQKDAETHDWLYQSALNLDQMLSNTIIQLARMEGMIDDENRIVEHPGK